MKLLKYSRQKGNLASFYFESGFSLRLTLVFLSAIIFIYILLRVNLINIPLDRDEGVFGYIGQVINDNGIPYVDAIDHKPPIVFYIYAFALKFFPPSAKGVHLFLHLYNFLTLIVLFFVVDIYSKSRLMALWTVSAYAVISSSPIVQGFTASTEMFMLLPISLSLLFIVLAIQKERLYYFILSGVCGALSFWIKQTGAFIILFVVLYFINVLTWRVLRKEKSLLDFMRDILLWGSGFIFISVLIAGYFYFNNAFNEFVYWSFTHSFFYSQKSSIFLMWPIISQTLKDLFTGNFMIILPGIAGCLIMVKQKDKRGIWALSFLLFSFLAICPGYAYWHYFAQLLPALSVTSGIGTVYLLQFIPKKSRSAFLTLIICSIIFVPFLVHYNYYVRNSPEENIRDLFKGNPFQESIELGKYIKEQTTDKDTIFIFGSEAQIFFYSERKSATAFALIYPLLTSFPKYMEFQHKAWKDIEQNDPKYIIFIEIQSTLSYDGKADLWIVRKIRELISTKYELEAVMTIDTPKGRILKKSELFETKNTFNHQQFPIKIFRKKEN
ncbi:MAG: glycosyltransferase family 39 protein [Desulfobacteraceae bacterium]|jgi:4-amino-4-deoxy-L-arabinose transferase-like glycosyltransferase|nr:glycosyltransferase family 39 protein [Desulfobacteraceae bacterium]